MRYLCLVYHDEKELDAMPAREHDAIEAETLAYRDELHQSGRVIASDALQRVQTATTIQVRNDRVVLTDGPVAETKEQLGGFYLIEAADLNEAIRVASRIPSARLATIEVRPVQELTPM